MDYSVLQKVTVNGSTSTAVTVHSNDEKGARMEFHQILASAYANTGLEKLNVAIINDNNHMILKESYTAETEETTED